MTSGGTDIIEMSSSTPGSTTGAALDVVVDERVSTEVDVEAGIVESAVVGATVAATADVVDTGGPGEVAVLPRPLASEVQAVVRSANTTRLDT
ncbi:MAG: hypothetical protein ABI894_01705 [Ilumatobacteraceae bacterium]